ncbi:MAG: signal peptidase I [Eubacterium sp.]|nr:signal peptidase I [Eubacterium sp.]
MSKTKKRLVSFGRIILLVIISLIIGIRLYGWNAQSIAGNAMPMPFGYGASVVLSGSMEPTISIDDLVIVHEQDSYETDDIVVYQDGNMLVVHRIISINGDEVITQGDANNAPDNPISMADIKGKAIAHIHYAGMLISFFETPAGFILIIAVMIALHELPNLRERKKSAKEQERIKEEIKRLKDGNSTNNNE